MIVHISGTYRSRVRVHLGFFWIVQPWRKTNFDKTVFVPKAGSIHVDVGPVTLAVAQSGKGVEASLAFMGTKVFATRFAVPGESRKFHAEPFRGAILNGTFAVS